MRDRELYTANSPLRESAIMQEMESLDGVVNGTVKDSSFDKV